MDTKWLQEKVWACSAMGHEDSPPRVWVNLIFLKLQGVETGDSSSLWRWETFLLTQLWYCQSWLLLPSPLDENVRDVSAGKCSTGRLYTSWGRQSQATHSNEGVTGTPK